ncbi:MAG: malectin domain-containing carbohydrate-binding protein [Actinomycetota bacterium]|nr:malectin domain-containing carbohydrate-binding protein [Actinomycetota bacterium]
MSESEQGNFVVPREVFDAVVDDDWTTYYFTVWELFHDKKNVHMTPFDERVFLRLLPFIGKKIHQSAYPRKGVYQDYLCVIVQDIMGARWARTLVCVAVSLLMVTSFLIFPARASASGAAQVIVELRNNLSSGTTGAGEFSRRQISGTDNKTCQTYKFQRERVGKNFSYVVANLPPEMGCSVELSFVEQYHSSEGKRIFNVYIQSEKVIDKLDIYSKVGGNKAYQQTFKTSTDSSGIIELTFRSDESGCENLATVSTIRIFNDSRNLVEIDASKSRQSRNEPIRHQNSAGDNSHEAVLGRFGSRLCLNLAPQKLGVRFSPLGDGTAELSEFVLAMKSGSKMKALPFTDRFPLWERISQSQTMTSQVFSCSSGDFPIALTVSFRAPFYPEGEKLSSAPFFYVDVEAKNVGSSPISGSFLLGLPHKETFEEGQVTEGMSTNSAWVQALSSYNYYDETHNSAGAISAWRGIGTPLADADDVDLKGGSEEEYKDFTTTSLWEFDSPEGYPSGSEDYRSPLFSFYPRGYSGAVWSISNLSPSASTTKSFMLGGFVPGKVLSVKNTSYSDASFRFSYYARDFEKLEDVFDYAVQERNEGDAIEEKSRFFDSTISSDSYLKLKEPGGKSAKELICYAFQSFIMNTWWTVSDSGREWFSVWEGSSCRYHSTVDVTYNDAWFYIYFWPDLLPLIFDEWLLYVKPSKEGNFLSHDMGWGSSVTGQAYYHDMPVEENTDFILLLYKYWKATGSTAYTQSKFLYVKDFLDFIANCDTNGNGIPDIHTKNTIDQGSPGIQSSRDQTYLGLKCAFAYQAGCEMALAQSKPDVSCASKYRAHIEAINQTLEQDLALSDHFAVSLDGNIDEANRRAYSIYTSNGIPWFFSSDRKMPLTQGNMEKLREDAESACIQTRREYGCIHTTYDISNQWVSQNVWRDIAACYLKANLNDGNPLSMLDAYWQLENYFAATSNGTFFDSLFYPHGIGGGGSSQGGRIWLGESDKSLAGKITKEESFSGGGSWLGSYIQSLTNYPRGVASLGLIDAACGITLDSISDSLYYEPASYPIRIPVFPRADWGNPDPQKRVPTIYLSSSSAEPSFQNRSLLPGTVAPRRLVSISGVKTGGHAISPNDDGANDVANIDYELPVKGKVNASIWDGEEEVRTYLEAELPAGKHSISWDGKQEGLPVDDGVYSARIDCNSSDKRYEVNPTSVPVYVNRTIPELSQEWYLAEGYTGGNEVSGDFEEYILIQNPGSEVANVEVTFMLSDGENLLRTYEVAPNSRFTITVDEILPWAEVSTHIASDRKIAVERAMYFYGRKTGHASIGISKPSKTWYLAEGYTAEDFDEYVLIQNPSDKIAKVTATFMTPGAGNVSKKYDIKPRSRFTIHVDDIIPAQSVSTQIISSEPVVVERAQYLNFMKSGTCSIGAPTTSKTWYLAEGSTDYGFEEWVLIQNPENLTNEVMVHFMDKEGKTLLRVFDIPPLSRFTILANGMFPGSDISVKIRSQYPVLAERAMYWNNRSDGHATIGTSTPDESWYLAEGYSEQGFETWILVQNPGEETRKVNFTFMEPSGKTTSRTFDVQPQSRFTLDMRGVVGETEASTQVSSDGPIIVERSIYFNERSGGTCGTGIRGTN